MNETRTCLNCGISIEGRRTNAIYCGGPCRAEASRKRAAQKPATAWDDLWDSLIGKSAQKRTGELAGGGSSQ